MNIYNNQQIDESDCCANDYSAGRESFSNVVHTTFEENPYLCKQIKKKYYATDSITDRHPDGKRFDNECSKEKCD